MWEVRNSDRPFVPIQSIQNSGELLNTCEKQTLCKRLNFPSHVHPLLALVLAAQALAEPEAPRIEGWHSIWMNPAGLGPADMAANGEKYRLSSSGIGCGRNFPIGIRDPKYQFQSPGRRSSMFRKSRQQASAGWYPTDG